MLSIGSGTALAAVLSVQEKMRMEIYSPPDCVACRDRASIDLRQWALGCWCVKCLRDALECGAESDTLKRMRIHSSTGEGDG